MKTLGIGMVGARYGARMHLANYAKLPRDLVEIRGVCSRTKESAAAFAKESQIAFITDDYNSLLARKDIDVIDICTPPALHHEFAIHAAKHIIMEKPLTGYFGENHSGSNSVFSRDWKSTGGGALLRMGMHSVGACLHLKQWEGQLRLGKGI